MSSVPAVHMGRRAVSWDHSESAPFLTKQEFKAVFLESFKSRTFWYFRLGFLISMVAPYLLFKGNDLFREKIPDSWSDYETQSMLLYTVATGALLSPLSFIFGARKVGSLIILGHILRILQVGLARLAALTPDEVLLYERAHDGSVLENSGYPAFFRIASVLCFAWFIGFRLVALPGSLSKVSTPAWVSVVLAGCFVLAFAVVVFMFMLMGPLFILMHLIKPLHQQTVPKLLCEWFSIGVVSGFQLPLLFCSLLCLGFDLGRMVEIGAAREEAEKGLAIETTSRIQKGANFV